MRAVLIFVFSLLAVFSDSLQAIPQIQREEFLPRKWVTHQTDVYGIDGNPFLVRAFLTANESCRGVWEVSARVRCLLDFSALPQETEPLQKDEVEALTKQGVLIRITKEVFCAAIQMMRGKTTLLGSCDAAWEKFTKEQKGKQPE